MLTVIIPVYKVEDTLDRCLRSVTSQSFRKLEILLVDDGSPDYCPQICDRWAKEDSRIRVIHKQHGGLSSARNAAIDVAAGEFITFVDSDDYLDLNTYTDVLGCMTGETDIAEYPVWKFYGSRRQSLLTFNEMSYSGVNDYWIGCQAYKHSYAWNKIYRRELFNDVRFPEGKVFEDAQTLPRLLAKARKVKTTSKGLYYYCDNPQGITSTATGDELRQLLMAHVNGFAPITDERYYLHVLNIQLDVCAMTGDEPQLNRLKIKNVWRLGAKNGLKMLMLNLAGLHNLCRLYKIKFGVAGKFK